MMDGCFLQDKEASRLPGMEDLFCSSRREFEVPPEQTDGHTYMQTQTIVPGFGLTSGHSEPNFYQYRFVAALRK